MTFFSFGKLRDSETTLHEKTMGTVITDYEKNQLSEFESLTEDQKSVFLAKLYKVIFCRCFSSSLIEKPFRIMQMPHTIHKLVTLKVFLMK
jgi:hypothetical protein